MALISGNLVRMVATCRFRNWFARFRRLPIFFLHARGKGEYIHGQIDSQAMFFWADGEQLAVFLLKASNCLIDFRFDPGIGAKWVTSSRLTQLYPIFCTLRQNRSRSMRTVLKSKRIFLGFPKKE